MDKIILTKDDIIKIKKQIHELKTKIIPQINKELKTAIEDGDLRENAPFDIAKHKFVEAKNKLHMLQEMLKKAKIMNNKSTIATKKIIKLGSQVLIEMDGQKKVIQIVSDFDADFINNKFSTNSPIAKQLLNRKEGEVITVITPNGKKINVRILKITN